MVREIIKPQSEVYNLHIPKEYMNQDIEILILPFSYPHSKQKDNPLKSDILKKTAGLLAGMNIDPLEWQKQIRNEWDDR